MPLTVIALDFDPVLRVAGLAVRLETLVAAVGVLLALLLAAAIARATPAPDRDDDDGAPAQRRTLRVDDLLFVVLAAIPGAVIGGRLGYVLLHADYYRANPLAIVDPAQGSLELALGVAGAALTGGYGAWLLGESPGRWFHVAAVPTLVAIGFAKLAMALGGSGQGQPAALDWATSYPGAGPWGSLAPGIPSHPSQLYEAIAVAGVALLLAVVGTGGFGRRDGVAWAVAIGGWAIARTLIAATWRDAPVLGPLRAGQLLSVALAVGCLVAVVLIRTRPAMGRSVQPEPRWPDPETRPPF